MKKMTRTIQRPKSTSPAPADIEGALDALGIAVHRRLDDEIFAKCPMHKQRTGSDDRNPSWSVNASTGIHHCFSCGYKGTFLDLVMDLRRDNDIFAALRWIRTFGITLDKVFNLPEWGREGVVEETDTSITESRLAAFADVPDMQLHRRKVSRESVDHFRLRWATTKECWIIPIRDGDKLIGWQEKAKGYFKNVPYRVKKSRCLFGLHVFQGNTAILVESPLDVVRLHTLGYEGGLSSYGVRVSARQMKLVIENADSLILALDNDKDGRLRTDELLKEYATKIPTWVFNYGDTDKKDIGEMTPAQIEQGIESSIHSTRYKR